MENVVNVTVDPKILEKIASSLAELAHSDARLHGLVADVAGEILVNKSKERQPLMAQARDLVTEHPYITAAVAVTGVVAIAGVTYAAYNRYASSDTGMGVDTIEPGKLKVVGGKL